MCCGGTKVARSVMRAIEPLLRARPVLDELVVILSIDPPELICPYCKSDFENRVHRTQAGVWVNQRWCAICKMRFP